MTVGEPARAAVPSDIDPATTSAAPASPREATLRALVAGAAIGLLLAAGNVYTSLKVSVIDGGGITAALLGFGIFAAFKRSRSRPYGALENNITQTAASSAAVMSFVTGVVGPIPGLALMGTRFSTVSVIVFGAAVGMFGIFVAALLRRRLIVEEALPFPTGIATGEVIETIFGARQVALRRILFLTVAAGLSAAVTWFRDARPALIPQGFMFPGALAGVTAATLSLGVSCSPLMLSTGALVGLRGALGMALGAATARVVLSPWLFRSGIVTVKDFGAFNSWLVWPSLGLLVAGSFLPLLLEGGAIARSFRQLAQLGRRSPGGITPGEATVGLRRWAPLLAASVAVLVVVGWWVFGMSPLVTLLALVLALVLANVSARATGETDFSPGGAVGTTSLIALASRGTVSGVMGGSVAMGVTTQTSQMLWSFRAGHHLGASPRAQIGAQILGVLVGAAVTVPVYLVISSSWGLGSETMPAVAALSWKATAEVMHGMSALPRLGGAAALVGLAAGVALTLLGRLRIGRMLADGGGDRRGVHAAVLADPGRGDRRAARALRAAPFPRCGPAVHHGDRGGRHRRRIDHGRGHRHPDGDRRPLTSAHLRVEAPLTWGRGFAHLGSRLRSPRVEGAAGCVDPSVLKHPSAVAPGSARPTCWPPRELRAEGSTQPTSFSAPRFATPGTPPPLI